MTKEQKIIRAKAGQLKLAKQLGNVNQACKMMGYSRDSFYRFRELYEAGGELAVQELTRRKPILKNRTAPEVEAIVVGLSLNQPTYGQIRIANELRKLDHSISPIALEAVKRIDALFDIERDINGFSVEKRLAARQERSAALVATLEAWMRAERAKLSRHAAVAKAMDDMLTRWGAFTRFLDDGRICLTNNAAERALRGLALGRKSWLFAGSERGAERTALMYTLIQIAKLNDVDPQACLAHVLARIADTPQTQLAELLPWKWDPKRAHKRAA
jgi:hypothetical protein